MLEAGVDIIEIERVKAAVDRYGGRFLDRVFTPNEVAESRGRPESLAARFAAKEAAIKVLGERVGWREVELERDAGGKPRLSLHGRARTLAQAMGVRDLSVSISHCREYAVAIVVAS